MEKHGWGNGEAAVGQDQIVTDSYKARYLRYASSFVVAAYRKYTADGTRDSGIPKGSQALISGFIRIRRNGDFSQIHQVVSI